MTSPPLGTLTQAALAGDRRALSRLLTAFDDGTPAGSAAAAAFAARAGRARVVGITGVPGSGKSTLVNALLGAWLGRGETVAVVAIDPSSPISGGAVLGDRIRMGEHGSHPNAFVRSFSARGELGGLSKAARAAVDAFDACGFDRVVVETVGTGQSETRIAALADTKVVVCPPGLGDDVQAIKAGTLEIADILAISKADLPLSAQTGREMREMLTLRRAPERASDWTPQVVAVRAQQAGGVDELLEAIEQHERAVGRGRRLRSDAVTPGESKDPDPARSKSVVAPGTTEIRDRLATLAASDGLCRTLGITFIAGGAGHTELAMTVDAMHLNFNGGCHGGSIFALADSAFGLASNSHGPLASGIDAHITYQAGIRAGDTLLARAREMSRSRRIATYRVDVVRAGATGGETLVSSFTGTVAIKA